MLKHTVTQEAQMIRCEALRRAVLNIETFIDNNASRHQEKLVALRLAKEYDRMVERYGFDTHENLTERTIAKYA